MQITPDQLNLLQTAFRPHSPIEDPNAFFGRDSERTCVLEALSQAGLQVVVYGERGCGKTSLVNVATEGFVYRDALPTADGFVVIVERKG